MLEAGEGVVINGVLYEREEDWKKQVVPDDDGIASPGEPEIASVTGSAGSSQTGKTTGTLATGVFTATSTPRMVGQRSPASDTVSVTLSAMTLSLFMSISMLVSLFGSLAFAVYIL